MTESTIDISRLKKLLGNSDAMVAQFLEIFKEEIPNHLNTIRSALITDDWDAISINAHGIRGQVSYLELTDLARIAQFIEEAAQSRQRTAEIPVALNELESQLRHIIERL